MGWMFSPYDKYRYANIDEYFDNEHKLSGDYEYVGKGALVNFSEYYRAVLNKKTNQYTCLVCLVSFAEAGSIGIKSMDETMMPYAFNCPRRILNIISKTEPVNEHAKTWRENVELVLQKREMARKIRDGSIIKFDKPITFTNGAVGDTFKIVEEGKGKRKRKYFTMAYCNNRFIGLFRIRNWQKMDYTVLS